MMRKPVHTFFVAILLTCASAAAQAPSKFNEATIAQLQAALSAGQVSSVALTQFYITRILTIDQKRPGVNSVIELNPDALALARNADVKRFNGGTHRAADKDFLQERRVTRVAILAPPPCLRAEPQQCRNGLNSNAVTVAWGNQLSTGA